MKPDEPVDRRTRRPARAWRRLLVLVVTFAATTTVSADGSVAIDRPETPSRQAVVEAMNRVSPAASRCGNGWSGLVQTRLVFEGATGATTSVTTADPNVPREVGRCVEQAASAARVPPFRRSQYVVSYPFRLE